MYKFENIKEVHVELTSNCQAKCPMCSRNFHGGIVNPLVKVNDIDLEFFKQTLSNKFLQQLTAISLCGNFGDPILNQELIPIIQYIAAANPRIKVDLHTNGSARSTSWWKQLANAMPENHTVHFALDGLADTHSFYRIGTDWAKIIENATAFINANGTAQWVFITFKHNEHQLEMCRKLAKELKFDSFFEKQTARFIGNRQFDVLDSNRNVTHKLEQPSDTKLIFIDRKTVANYKNIFKNATIKCEVENSENVYIDANGYVWPCCFVGAVQTVYSEGDQVAYSFQQDSKASLLNLLDKFGGIQQFNLRVRALQDIINSTEWQTVWNDSFKTNPLPICTRTCGKFPEPTISQTKDQFLKLNKFNE
jgi:MoaA/NifB/PqqE/SkfB family radical SAM enzyme